MTDRRTAWGMLQGLHRVIERMRRTVAKLNKIAQLIKRTRRTRTSQRRRKRDRLDHEDLEYCDLWDRK